MSENLGQILPGTPFGDLLTQCAKESETIFEIGTWRGQGSTLCLASGLIRSTQRLWTVDQAKEIWIQAKSHYLHEHRVRFLCAHALDILDELPLKLDLVLFDGSDEQTDSEFDALYDRLVRFVALDDTRERKNARQRKLCLERGWTVIGDDQQDRNGWSIFKHP